MSCVIEKNAMIQCGAENSPFFGQVRRKAGCCNETKCHPLLLPLIPVVQMLDRTLRIDYEIVLHDVSGPKHKIVAIAHGELTDVQNNLPY